MLFIPKILYFLKYIFRLKTSRIKSNIIGTEMSPLTYDLSIEQRKYLQYMLDLMVSARQFPTESHPFTTIQCLQEVLQKGYYTTLDKPILNNLENVARTHGYDVNYK